MLKWGWIPTFMSDFKQSPELGHARAQTCLWADQRIILAYTDIHVHRTLPTLNYPTDWISVYVVICRLKWTPYFRFPDPSGILSWLFCHRFSFLLRDHICVTEQWSRSPVRLINKFPKFHLRPNNFGKMRKLPPKNNFLNYNLWAKE